MELANEFLQAALGSHSSPPLLPEDDDEEWLLEEGGGAGVGEEPGQGEEPLDWGAGPEECVRRIESCTLWLLDQLTQGLLPNFEIASRAATNRTLEATGQGEEFALRLQQRTVTRSLAGRHPDSADQVARIFLVLNVCHEMLLEGASATQREVYYRLKTQECVRSLHDVVEAVQDCVSLLRVPRSALGICASSKGLVAGLVIVHDRRTGSEVDYSRSTEGQPISGDISVLGQLAFQTEAQCVVVVEKDAVFQRLLEQQFPQLARCVLVTGKGVPDLATRAFLAALASAFPALELYALVDWNPAGVQIAAMYKFGSHRMGLESPRYALPRLRWLGARACQLRDADGSEFQALTSRDRAMIGSLGATLRQASPAWVEELQQMADSDSKAEMEAVYSTCGGSAGFVDLLLAALEAGDAV